MSKTPNRQTLASLAAINHEVAITCTCGNSRTVDYSTLTPAELEMTALAYAGRCRCRACGKRGASPIIRVPVDETGRPFVRDDYYTR